jgi:hypothetical protein
MIAGIAAAVVLAILGGVWAFTRKPDAPVTNTVVSSTSGTEVTTTATPKPLTGDQGLLLLSAAPWGELDRIVSKSDQKEVPLTADDREIPSRIRLQQGEYTITVNGPQGSQTMDVRITAGQSTRTRVNTGDVDLNELEREMTRT